MKHSEQLDKIIPALISAQAKMPVIEKDSRNPHFNSMYASLDGILRVVKPVLQSEGLGLVQSAPIPETDEHGQLTGFTVETMLVHTSGQFIVGCAPMPLAKATPQGAGASITYGRRYSVAGLLALVIDEDDDGNAASVPAAIAPRTGPSSPLQRPSVPVAQVMEAVKQMESRAPTAAKNALPSCPSCSGPMWDNRADSAKRVAEGKKATPWFKCKNAPKTRGADGCPGIIWEKDYLSDNAVTPPKQEGSSLALVPEAEFPAALKDEEDDLPF